MSSSPSTQTLAMMPSHHLFQLRHIKKLPHAYIFEFAQVLHGDDEDTTQEMNALSSSLSLSSNEANFTINKSFLYTSMIRLKIQDPSTEKPYTPFHLFMEQDGIELSETDSRDADSDSEETLQHCRTGDITPQFQSTGPDTTTTPKAESPCDRHPRRLVVRYLVKIYSNGHMGQHWTKLQIQDCVMIRFIAMRCTSQESPYCGTCTGDSFAQRVGILCGGTGISSCWQYLNRMKQEGKSVDMIAAYNSLDEVVMEPEHQHPYYEYETVVKKLASKGVHFFATVQKTTLPDHVDREDGDAPPSSMRQWKGGKGLITRDMIRIMLPSPFATSVKIIVCGPPPMIRFFCGTQCADKYMKRLYEGDLVEGYETAPLEEGSVLHELGYESHQVVIL
uniref:Oxidoreductase FAD/NAD(P)-binding domain-containing protein n=1 Tax=Percolomonas cosmopolitus TaxID=63605 RepID=A0A7S1PFB3_9EUKA|mmetsp:Transcript_10718/g.40134  ORF Transcript_10718/g.40134 Transcript_10718/m.40134 type:complete len:391 (+) Transcript_10718:32-1204(+)